MFIGSLRLAAALRKTVNVSLVATMAAGLAAADAAVVWAAECTAERPSPMVAVDPDLCQRLESVVRKPSAFKLDQYERNLNQYLGHYCHRNEAAGWVRDKFVRDTGPFIATLEDGVWTSAYHGTHAPVVIWYSPEMAAWLKANRPVDGSGPADPPAIPDGAIMVKEMFPDPGSACRAVDPLRLFPTRGATIMVRDSAASHDGWFWGWYGFGPASGWTPDWPNPDNSLPNMGFAPYCMNCHASATDNLTFADPRNIQGEPGDPLVFLSQNFFTPKPTPTLHELVALPPPDGYGRLGEPSYRPDDKVIADLRAYTQTMPTWENVSKMPSETYDNTWVGAGGPDASDTFLTSSQCIGCHDAGSTGLQFDMTMPNPHGDNLINLSPYGTWRTSPMGLGGRDPIFFAQLASETQTFHPEVASTVEDKCLGCHGITGQRQFHIDEHAKTGECPDFSRDMVNTAPYPHGNQTELQINYGALARDGISCTACHRMVFGAESEAVADEPQNACVTERQEFLNPNETGFAKTFTGSFMVGAPDKLIGPFADPKTQPMKNALGNTPVHSDTITSSELCGSCHTVHLPVMKDGKAISYVYEQTTYAEWAFSSYRTGKTADGMDLPSGAGTENKSCQDCHMTTTNADGSPTMSRIASIQEHSNFPIADNALGADDLDLPIREGFARHTLVGLNVFLVKMAQQFPDIFGIRTQDPMMVSMGVDPLITTEQAMLDQAADTTASIAVSDVTVSEDTLRATVTVSSDTGHKFPSGVGFRRAFVAFRVIDQNGETLWESGRTNAAGAIVDDKGEPIDGEFWWKDDCSGYVDPGERPHQPHFQEIGSQSQAQIYQELVSAPPEGVAAPVCDHAAPPAGELTTSFLSICTEVKDNRILPKGYLPLEERKAIAAALGAGDDLAEDAGSTGVGEDPDYMSGGSDSLVYEVPLSELPTERPASVEATLYYQATPPFYLQDRFCTGEGPDKERLLFLTGHLNLDGTKADGWKLQVATSGQVALPVE